MSHLRVLTACCLCAAFATVVAAADPVITSGADLAASNRASRDAEQKLLSMLHQKITADWTDTPIEEVLMRIAAETSIPVWIDKQALQDEGINADVQVTLHLSELTVWQTMHFLLPPLALSWTAPDGVLVITTQTKADEQMHSRLYDISAIAKVLEPELHTEIGTPQHLRRIQPPMGMTGGGMGGMGGGGMFSVGLGINDSDSPTSGFQPETGKDEPPSFIHAQFGGMGGMGMGMAGPAANVEFGYRIGSPPGPRTTGALMAMLHSCLDAKWSQQDGEGGAIAVVPGQLMIRQTYQTHFEIQALLNAIEGFLVRGVKAKALEVRRPGYPYDEDAKIIKQLAEPVDFEAVDQPLPEALQSLFEGRGIRFWIDAQSLQDEGINTDTQVSLALKGSSLNSTLKFLLNPLWLQIIVQEGTVIVTTQTRADEQHSTVVHNTADLPGITPQSLAQVIRQCTSQKWMDQDGEGGAQHLLGTHLNVIHQTQKGHIENAALLDDLRKNADPKQPPAAPKMEQRIYLVADTTAIADLIRTLPELVENWDAKQGSIHRFGETLMINQSQLVHNRVGEVIGALNSVHSRLHPTRQPATPAAPPATQPPPAVQPPAAVPPAVPAKPAEPAKPQQ